MTHVALSLAIAVLLFQACFWAMRMWEVIQTTRMVPEIDPDKKSRLPSHPPLISVIVPAHNEQAGIGECLRSVLDQDYPHFELVFVNDRSDDDTLAVAESVVQGRDDLRIISVTDLPKGWTGKCHALDAGVRQASGEWLAFLDADCRLHKSALRECYCASIRHNVGMITLSPKFVLKTFWEKALQPAFVAMSCILFPLALVNHPSSTVASANGMFYMIRRHVYEKIGGHRDVKGLAVEDIGIGKRVKAAGLGLLFANGRRIMQTRMYVGFNETIHGWTRILSASMNYEMPIVIKYLCVHILVSLPALLSALYIYVPQAYKLWPETWFFLPFICFLAMTFASTLFCSQMGVPRKYSVFLIIGNLMLVWVFFVILKKTALSEPLQWRGTTYDFNRYEPAMLDPVPARSAYTNVHSSGEHTVPTANPSIPSTPIYYTDTEN
ncbi:MAG TPA: glycosyltransferase [Desulfomonilaceae bacterium]|nr:glycosyltransferase [Desulfomonilaceae bacterium]